MISLISLKLSERSDVLSGLLDVGVAVLPCMAEAES